MTAVICRTGTFPRRQVAHCPTCKQRRRFAGYDAAWYGTRWTCCGCGDSWGDGEMLPRPFARGWRAEAIARAKRIWAEAAGLTRADHRAWLQAELDASKALDVESVEPSGGVL